MLAQHVARQSSLELEGPLAASTQTTTPSVNVGGSRRKDLAKHAQQPVLATTTASFPSSTTATGVDSMQFISASPLADGLVNGRPSGAGAGAVKTASRLPGVLIPPSQPLQLVAGSSSVSTAGNGSHTVGNNGDRRPLSSNMPSSAGTTTTKTATVPNTAHPYNHNPNPTRTVPIAMNVTTSTTSAGTTSNTRSLAGTTTTAAGSTIGTTPTATPTAAMDITGGRGPRASSLIGVHKGSTGGSSGGSSGGEVLGGSSGGGPGFLLDTNSPSPSSAKVCVFGLLSLYCCFVNICLYDTKYFNFLTLDIINLSLY